MHVFDLSDYLHILYGLTIFLVLCVLIFKQTKVFLVVIMTIAALVLGFSAEHVFGNPSSSKLVLKQEYVYRHHFKKGESIYVWLEVKNLEKLYVFPYSRELKRQLDRGKSGQEKGQIAKLKRTLTKRNEDTYLIMTSPVTVESEPK